MVKIKISYNNPEEKDRLLKIIANGTTIKKIKHQKEGKYKKLYIDIE